MEIVEITSGNVASYSAEVAKIHADAYSDGHFTSTFGLRKLAEYNRLLIENSDISLVAVEGNRVLGFLISGEAVSRGVSQFIRSHRGFLVTRLLAHPYFLLDKIRAKLKSAFAPPPTPVAKYRLLSIASAPSAQSRGVGAKLLAALEGRLRQRGIANYGLSVRAANTRAVTFYQSNGFVCEKEDSGSLYFRKSLGYSSSNNRDNRAGNELQIQ
ncbi:GNAT family N-acetyltransferase [Altererythrobacter soli]|uniref:GNAT family N-acetyltransferase n=1 Tax=Croceibacterium soli TaxID=1739690 RepID=A0A6I4UR99_9SPHN|nr:GNAT family N-acetyltransferase [Croceibacterium soli]MXP40264.1 GNAT family N-acetyltransferase [Croceibacterium soli]